MRPFPPSWQMQLKISIFFKRVSVFNIMLDLQNCKCLFPNPFKFMAVSDFQQFSSKCSCDKVAC